MQIVITSHRHAETILKKEYAQEWNELLDILGGISDQDIINQFPKSANKMSISSAINDLIDKRLIKKKWDRQPAIFCEEPYVADTRWRLDFAKRNISVEVAFNHGEAIAWNLIKPTLASELNHVKKAIQTQVGVVIFATQDMKNVGAFDGSVGSYEKALRYLKPMQNQLSTPTVIIGLLPPTTFHVQKVKKGNTNIGQIKSGQRPATKIKRKKSKKDANIDFFETTS